MYCADYLVWVICPKLPRGLWELDPVGVVCHIITGQPTKQITVKLPNRAHQKKKYYYVNRQKQEDKGDREGILRTHPIP